MGLHQNTHMLHPCIISLTPCNARQCCALPYVIFGIKSQANLDLHVLVNLSMDFDSRHATQMAKPLCKTLVHLGPGISAHHWGLFMPDISTYQENSSIFLLLAQTDGTLFFPRTLFLFGCCQDIGYFFVFYSSTHTVNISLWPKLE